MYGDLDELESIEIDDRWNHWRKIVDIWMLEYLLLERIIAESSIYNIFLHSFMG